MKKFLYAVLLVVIVYVVLGFFVAIVPFSVKAGYHGRGGEFCGIVYQPSCDQKEWRLFKWDEVVYLMGSPYK